MTNRTVTIASGASLSDTIDLARASLLSLQLPPSWTAAALTFTGSLDGVTFVPLYWQGAEYSLTVAASQGHALEPSVFAGWRYIKLRSGTAAAPVNQAASRSIMVAGRIV